MLLVDDMLYKNMFNDSYNANFLESFDNLHGDDHYLLGLFSLIWKIFIPLDTMFPHL